MTADWPALPENITLDDIRILADWFADQQNVLHEQACRLIAECGYTPRIQEGELCAWGLQGCPPAWKQADLPPSIFYRLPGAWRCRAVRYATQREAYVGLIKAVVSELSGEELPPPAAAK
jgi:hypothetical protein